MDVKLTCSMSGGLSRALSSRRIILGLTALLALSASCSKRGDLADVRGKVTLDGQPLANAFVVFAPTEHGTTSYGRTDANGSYEMMFTDNEKGAWIGNNSVRISTGDLGTGGGPGPKERVPIVYNEATTLTADVKPGKNAFDFDLKSNAGQIKGAPKE
ncbi:MAG TPA: carboxypeptidase-like regulatory domain-containing protein [Pirellulaceae bacterium]